MLDQDPFDDDAGDYDWLPEEEFTVALVTLTVAESKRLIAKGVAADPRVQAAMEEGMVAVCKGTTNAYVLEELLGQDVEKGKYVLGRVVPAGNKEAEKAFSGSIPEVVLRNGEPVAGLTLADAVKEMTVGDVVIKGANLLDYQNSRAGVLVGHPEGGTLGTIMGAVYGKGLFLLIPVGLEKQIASPLSLISVAAQPATCAMSDLPRVWLLDGTLVTEIEALRCLTGVEALQVAAGGVCGAEGAVQLMIVGPMDDVDEARALVEQVRGEPSFWDAVMGDKPAKPARKRRS